MTALKQKIKFVCTSTEKLSKELETFTNRIFKVIDSCTTIEQLNVAQTYCNLLIYRRYSKLSTNLYMLYKGSTTNYIKHRKLDINYEKL